MPEGKWQGVCCGAFDTPAELRLNASGTFTATGQPTLSLEVFWAEGFSGTGAVCYGDPSSKPSFPSPAWVSNTTRYDVTGSQTHTFSAARCPYHVILSPTVIVIMPFFSVRRETVVLPERRRVPGADASWIRVDIFAETVWSFERTACEFAVE